MRLRLWLVPALALLWGPGGLEALGRPPRRQRYGEGLGGTAAGAGRGVGEGETTPRAGVGSPSLLGGGPPYLLEGGEWGGGCGAWPALWGAVRCRGPVAWLSARLEGGPWPGARPRPAAVAASRWVCAGERRAPWRPGRPRPLPLWRWFPLQLKAWLVVGGVFGGRCALQGGGETTLRTKVC